MPTPRCLLCDAPVGDDDQLRRHLADEHGLEDDPGTESQLADLQGSLISPAVEATDLAGGPAGAAGPLALGGIGPPPAARVHDPSSDDDRWRPVTLGVGGVLLLVLCAIAIELAT